jgi:hypothetical protein
MKRRSWLLAGVGYGKARDKPQNQAIAIFLLDVHGWIK